MAHGIRCSRKRVAPLMCQLGPEGAHRRKRRDITRRDPRGPVFPDRVQRAFAMDGPDRLWVADLTQHPTQERWLYLATVLDTFSLKVVGWAMGERPTAEQVIDALNMVLWNGRLGSGLVHHSDHGAHYTSLAISRRLEAAGFLGSMGSVGGALDHAVPGSLVTTLQAELLNRHSGPPVRRRRWASSSSSRPFTTATGRRSAMGYLSPGEFRRRWRLHHELSVPAA